MTTSPDTRPVTKTESDDAHATLRCLASAGCTVDDYTWLRKPGNAQKFLELLRQARGSAAVVNALSMVCVRREHFPDVKSFAELMWVIDSESYRMTTPDELRGWGEKYWSRRSKVATIGPPEKDKICGPGYCCPVFTLCGVKDGIGIDVEKELISNPWSKDLILLIVPKLA